MTYTSPYTFTGKQRLALFFGAPAVALVLKAICSTCRIEVRGDEYRKGALLDREGRETKRVILAFWHEAILPAVWHHRYKGYHALTSYSYDGEFAARVLKRIGLPSLRGSSSRGGSEALAQLAIALKSVSTVGFTLDGPRGPRRVAKPGVAILAARTGAPILPYALVAVPAWRTNSWDKFMIPKPFSRIVATFGPAIPAPEKATPESVERTRARVEDAIRSLQEGLDSEFGINDIE